MDVTAGKKAKEAAVRLIGRHPFAEGIVPRRMRNGVKKVDRTDGREKGAGKGKKGYRKMEKVCMFVVLRAKKFYENEKWKIKLVIAVEKISNSFFLQVAFNHKKLFDRGELGNF